MIVSLSGGSCVLMMDDFGFSVVFLEFQAFIMSLLKIIFSVDTIINIAATLWSTKWLASLGLVTPDCYQPVLSNTYRPWWRKRERQGRGTDGYRDLTHFRNPWPMKVNPNKRLTSLALQPQTIENPHTPIEIFSHEYLLWATSHLRQPSLRNTIIQQSSFLVNRHFLFFILYSSNLSLFSLFSLFYSVIYLFQFIHSILCNSGFFFCSILLFEQCYTAMFFFFYILQLFYFWFLFYSVFCPPTLFYSFTFHAIPFLSVFSVLQFSSFYSFHFSCHSLTHCLIGWFKQWF